METHSTQSNVTTKHKGIFHFKWYNQVVYWIENRSKAWFFISFFLWYEKKSLFFSAAVVVNILSILQTQRQKKERILYPSKWLGLCYPRKCMFLGFPRASVVSCFVDFASQKQRPEQKKKNRRFRFICWCNVCVTPLP